MAFTGPRIESLTINGTISGFATWEGTEYQTAPFGLAEVNLGAAGRRGMWVFSQGASSFTFRAEGESRELSLRTGWNLASFADPGPIGNLTLPSSVLPTFTRLNADNSYTSVDASAGGLDGSRPYWIYSLAPVNLTWTGPAPSPTPSPSPSPIFVGGGGGGAAPTPIPSPIGGLSFANFPTSSRQAPLGADQVLAFQVRVLGPNSRVLESATPTVSLSLDAQPAGGNLTGSRSESATAGVAPFAGLEVDKVGCYRFRATATNCVDGVSPDLWIAAGPPQKVGFAGAPVVGTVGQALHPLDLQLQDAKGNLAEPGATTYPLSLAGAPVTTAGGNFDVMGRLSLTDAVVGAPGTYRLTASAPGLTNGVMAADLVVSAATPVTGGQLVFGPTFPATTTAGTTLPAFTVRVLDGNGDVVTSAEGTVQLDVPGGTAATGAVEQEPTQLSGTSVVNASVVDGVATFSSVRLTRAGNWNLRATWSGGLTSPPRALSVVAGATARLNFQPSRTARTPVQPATVAVANATVQGNTGANPLAATMVCEAQDAWGNRNLAETGAVQLAFSTAGRALQGVTSAVTAAGLATFNGATFPPGRLGVQTLTATMGALTTTTAPFSIVVEAASTFANGELGPRQVNAAGPHILSGDGRYVVYSRTIDGAGAHVWRKDTQTGEEIQIDVGSPDSRFSEVPAISPNGEYVVFRSNFAFPGYPTPPALQIWVWHKGTVSLVSHVDGSATQSCNLDCIVADVNDSGQIVYDTRSDNILPINHQGFEQVYMTQMGSTSVRLVTESAPGVMMNTLFPQTCSPTLSADGTKVAFGAFASDLPGFNPGFAFAIYRRDLTRPANVDGVVLVSAQPNFPVLLACGGFCQGPVISANGRYVVYFFQAINTDIASDDYSKPQVYRRDCDGPKTAYMQVSDGWTTSTPTGVGSVYPSISADGRYVAFGTSEPLRGIPASSGARLNAVRRDCDSTELKLLNLRAEGQTWSLNSVNTWPSIAIYNHTYCAFGSGIDNLYNSFNAAVFLSRIP